MLVGKRKKVADIPQNSCGGNKHPPPPDSGRSGADIVAGFSVASTSVSADRALSSNSDTFLQCWKKNEKYPAYCLALGTCALGRSYACLQFCAPLPLLTQLSSPQRVRPRDLADDCEQFHSHPLCAGFIVNLSGARWFCLFPSPRESLIQCPLTVFIRVVIKRINTVILEKMPRILYSTFYTKDFMGINFYFLFPGTFFSAFVLQNQIRNKNIN